MRSSGPRAEHHGAGQVSGPYAPAGCTSVGATFGRPPRFRRPGAAQKERDMTTYNTAPDPGMEELISRCFWREELLQRDVY